MEPLTGDDPGQIAGYRLSARLGSGGMGRVYLGATSSGRPVALKVLRPDLGGDPEFRVRFRREIDAARRVHGLYTAQVVDADPDASPPWLATVYVPGPSLQQAVTARGPMPAEQALALLAGVAEALGAIHAVGLVHRDLKPSNVLLAADGPRVIDFGIARETDATTLTRTGMLVGTAPFMSPEQVSGAAVTRATDVFALGAVAVFAATGRPPFGGGADLGILYRVLHGQPNLSDCPPRLREIAERCLAKEPADRPAPAEVIAACQVRPTGAAAGTGPAAGIGAAAGTGAARPAPGVAVPLPPAQDVAPPPASRAARAARAVGSRPVLLGGSLAAAAVLAFALVGLHLIGGHHGNPISPVTPSPARQVSYAVDRCVVGTWKDAGDVLDNTISGEPLQFTGAGGGLAIAANGSGRQQLGPEALTATDSAGDTYTEVLGGSVTYRVTTSHLTAGGAGVMRFSNVDAAPDAGYKLYKNGVFDSNGPMSVATTPLRFSCSPSTLRLTWSNGTSTYRRAGG